MRACRYRSCFRFCSSMSVFVPNQRTTFPDSSRCGSAPARCQRYEPSAARTLGAPVTTYHAMAPVVKELLRQLRKKRRVAARLIGVSASQLVHIGSEGGQLALFEEENPGRETDRHRDLAAAMDSVRSRYGRQAIKLGIPPLEE